MGQLTFYFDVCFGKRFPDSIAKAKPPFTVESFWSKRVKFKQNTPDDKWLEEIGKRKWIAFSHDRRFHTEDASIVAIKQHGVGCFYLPGANETTWMKLFMFMRAQHRIVEIASNTEKPFVYRLTPLNKIEKVKIP